MQRLVMSTVGHDAGRAESMLKEALDGMKPEDIGKDSDFDELFYGKVKNALKSSKTPAKKRKPTGSPEDDDETTITQEKKKTKTVPFPVSDDNLEPTQKAENKKTLDHLIQAIPQTGDARKCFVLQMTGFLAILSALHTCRDTVKTHLEQGGLVEGTDYEIDEDDGSVQVFEEKPSDEPAKCEDMKLLKLIVGASFDVSQLITFSTLVNRPEPNSYNWNIVGQMVLNRNVTRATGQNAYSQALEKELKQAAKAFPKQTKRFRSQNYNQRPWPRWQPSRSSNGYNRRGGNRGQGRGGGYGQGRGRGQGGARGGGPGRDQTGGSSGQ